MWAGALRPRRWTNKGTMKRRFQTPGRGSCVTLFYGDILEQNNVRCTDHVDVLLSERRSECLFSLVLLVLITRSRRDVAVHLITCSPSGDLLVLVRLNVDLLTDRTRSSVRKNIQSATDSIELSLVHQQNNRTVVSPSTCAWKLTTPTPYRVV